jgi:AcrR family transcriptional regulator
MVQVETRAERMQGVREKILSVAKRLFIEQGYKKTTIRQIVQESGITSGSIYNLFESKDAVFAAIANDLLDLMIAQVESRMADQDMLHRYAGLMGLEWYCIEQDPILRELCYEAYTEPQILETIIRKNMDLAAYYLEDADLIGDFRPEDYYARMVMTKGAMLGFIEFFGFEHAGNVRNLRRELANITFISVGLKKKDIKELYRFILDQESLFEEMSSNVMKGIHVSE